MNKIETVTTGQPQQFHACNEIPKVLADFLQEIAIENPAVTKVNLVPARLGWRFIQELFFETPGGITKRRVFGFDPVSACLEIRRNGQQCELVPIV